jgi:uncharacterized protein (TIGR02611 family)
LKRIATAVVGGLLTVIGIILLVLPGPGFVVIALGLAVLAREFAWARRPLDYAKKRGDEGLDQVARSWRYAALDALCGLVLIAIGVLDLVVGLPIIEVVGDIFVIPSGLFLVGTVFYARRRGPRGQQPQHSLDHG